MGAWLKLNGEAIYGAGPTPLGYELGHMKTVKQGKKQVEMTEGALDWRCTSKPGRLTYTCSSRPAGDLTITGITSKVIAARLLAAPQRKVPFTQSDTKLTLDLAGENPGKYATVVRLETAP